MKPSLVLSLLIVMIVCTRFSEQAKEKKVGKVLRLCGGAFLSTWQLSCCMKNDCTRMRRSTADIETMVKPNNDAVISEKFANTFLKMGYNLKRKRRNASSQDNALEECCNEKCSLEEVSEYPC